MNMTSHQSGSALLITLVLLVVLTVGSLAVARMSRVDFQTLRSSQDRAALFHSAESLLEKEFVLGPAPLATPRSHTEPVNGFDATSAVTYRGQTEVPSGGFSLGSGIGAYHFDVRSEAADPNGPSVVLVAGFYVVGPTE